MNDYDGRLLCLLYFLDRSIILFRLFLFSGLRVLLFFFRLSFRWSVEDEFHRYKLLVSLNSLVVLKKPEQTWLYWLVEPFSQDRVFGVEALVED